MDLAALTALTKLGFLNAHTAVIIGFCHGMADLPSPQKPANCHALPGSLLAAQGQE